MEFKINKQSNLDFRLMALTYKLRDFRLPRMNILSEVGIKTGFHVLDYGCGPGSYILPLAKLVGESGKIFALDIHPLAIETVKKIALKKQLTNVMTILSNCKTGLLPNSVDIVLLYDILHDLKNATEILAELYRVLKPKGILSVSDHHLKRDEIVSMVTREQLFNLSEKGRNILNFSGQEKR